MPVITHVVAQKNLANKSLTINEKALIIVQQSVSRVALKQTRVFRFAGQYRVHLVDSDSQTNTRSVRKVPGLALILSRCCAQSY